ncbi:MAG: response regulator [Planctomycetota bacterium]
MPEAAVHIVDDDEAVRNSLARLIASAGLSATAYADAESFLARHSSSEPAGCLVLDLRLPRLSGLDLQERLTERGWRIPIIIISGHGELEDAVRAMKRGAVDFIRKPYQPAALLAQIRAALETNRRQRAAGAERRAAQEALALLTPREREVADRLAIGAGIKAIAHALGLSRKTVDVHRTHIMSKLRLTTTFELWQLMQRANGGSASAPPADLARRALDEGPVRPGPPDIS